MSLTTPAASTGGSHDDLWGFLAVAVGVVVLVVAVGVTFSGAIASALWRVPVVATAWSVGIVLPATRRVGVARVLGPGVLQAVALAAALVTAQTFAGRVRHGLFGAVAAKAEADGWGAAAFSGHAGHRVVLLTVAAVVVLVFTVLMTWLFTRELLLLARPSLRGGLLGRYGPDRYVVGAGVGLLVLVVAAYATSVDAARRYERLTDQAARAPVPKHATQSRRGARK